MLKTIILMEIASKRYIIDTDELISIHGGIDHRMQGRAVTSYVPIKGLHPMICISDARVKGRGRENRGRDGTIAWHYLALD